MHVDMCQNNLILGKGSFKYGLGTTTLQGAEASVSDVFLQSIF